MKLTTGILAAVMMTGAAWGQNPDAIDNARSAAKSLHAIKTNESNAAQEASSDPTKPAAGAPAPAVKPAAIPGAKPADRRQASQLARPLRSQPKRSSAKVAPVTGLCIAEQSSGKSECRSQRGQCPDRDQPARSSHAEGEQVESRPPAWLWNLPATTMATAQSKIPVGSAGVKGVRIGMDGKMPPTTSVVVDLEQAFAYDVTPGPGNKFILTLHTQVRRRR